MKSLLSINAFNSLSVPYGFSFINFAYTAIATCYMSKEGYVSPCIISCTSISLRVSYIFLKGSFLMGLQYVSISCASFWELMRLCRSIKCFKSSKLHFSSRVMIKIRKLTVKYNSWVLQVVHEQVASLLIMHWNHKRQVGQLGWLRPIQKATQHCLEANGFLQHQSLLIILAEHLIKLNLITINHLHELGPALRFWRSLATCRF